MNDRMKKYPLLLSCFIVFTIVLTACQTKSEDIKDQIESVGDTEEEAKEAGGIVEKILGGASITLLSNQGESQMLSVIIETRDKSIIVIDGGTYEDTPYLSEQIKLRGGRVSAWFITHPHSDHIGALLEILTNKSYSIAIDKVYYSFAELDWYITHEEYRSDKVKEIMEALKTLPAGVIETPVKRGQEITIDDVTVIVMNEPYLEPNENAINNSSMAYMFHINGKKALFMGDMGWDAGNAMAASYDAADLKADIMQMTHHGQSGLSKEVYEIIRPEICLWPTPGWLWDNDNGGGVNSGDWKTLETRSWMDAMGVTKNYCIKDGDQVIR